MWRGETEGKLCEKCTWLPPRTCLLLYQRRQKLPSKNLAKVCKTSALNRRSEVINISTSKILPSKAGNYDELIYLVSFFKKLPFEGHLVHVPVCLEFQPQCLVMAWQQQKAVETHRMGASQPPSKSLLTVLDGTAFCKIYLVYWVLYFLSSFLTSK